MSTQIIKSKKSIKAKVILIIEDTPMETVAIKLTNNFNKLLLRRAFQKMVPLLPYVDREEDAGPCEDCGEQKELAEDRVCHRCYHFAQPKGECWCDTNEDKVEEPKFYLANGCIGKDFYKRHIKDEVTKATQKKFEALLKDEDEDFIEYYRVGISNPDDKAWEFSSLWFFDINLDKGYMPVFLSGVNTSSALAMEMCGIDRDDEDDEDNGRTLEELLDYAPNGNEKSKENIKKILLMKK